MGSERVDESQRADLAASPVHRAVWDRDVPVELFDTVEPEVSEQVERVAGRSLAILRGRVADGLVYGDDGVVSSDLIAELAQAGYWGLRVDPAYGGSGASFPAYLQSLAQIVTADPWVGVLGSMQAGLGPVTTLNAFGNERQKLRLLPTLARGERLGVFATTEPHTSSDLAAIATEATWAGDELLLSGEKLLITNAAPGRLATVLCRVDGELRVLMVELPGQEGDRFHTVRHGVRAFRHVHNRGLLFRELQVPGDNLLEGDGRMIAYHTLNYGRVAVCAGAAGLLRRVTASLIPWVQARTTFGAPIGTRELVRRRLGRLAARIVACDAVALWAAQLLEQGYRGELEGVVAKVFGSEMLAEGAVDMVLRTHGGRALLPGNIFADDVYDLLAPTVYEGENEILTLGFFRSLARSHAQQVLEPMGRSFKAMRRPALQPARRAAGSAAAYGRWLGNRELRSLGTRMHRAVPTHLDDLAELASRLLQTTGLETSGALRRYGAALADRQAIAIDLAQRAQQATAMLVVSRYGARQTDPLLRQSASCMAAELGHRLTGVRPSEPYQRLVTGLGEAVADDQFEPLQSADHASPILPGRLPAS